MIKYLNDVFLEQIVNLIDGLGTALINNTRKRGQGIKGLFRRNEKRKEPDAVKKWTLPNGQTIETY